MLHMKYQPQNLEFVRHNDKKSLKKLKIGVASYKVKNAISKEIMEKLPTEEELNLYINKLQNEEAND